MSVFTPQYGTAHGRDLGQDCGVFGVGIEYFIDGGDLSANAAGSRQQLRLIAGNVERMYSHAIDDGNLLAEQNTSRAMWLTTIIMFVEIKGGWIYNSTALLADGWHTSSHALALGLSAFAYAYARFYANNRRCAFDTWKIEILAGYTSAMLLLCFALRG